MIKPYNLTPFRRFCVTIGELPTSYMESLTYYEMLEWLCKYIEDTIIPAINLDGEAIKELQDKFVELKNYVDNYFTNLDVQQEINNKLDDMAESGELTEIITSYLEMKSILGYDTVSDMQSADNLINGSLAKTYGFHTINDGGGANYIIKTQTDEVVDNIHIFSITGTLLIAVLNESESINVKQLGAYGDNTHDDTDALSYAVNNFRNIYFPSGTYIFNEYEEDCYAYNLYGTKAEIKRTSTDGLAYMFRFNHNVNISDLKFNSNNVGRGCIMISGADNCYIENCDFTGYSNDYGHYQTDSLLLLNGIERGVVENCNFHESGYELQNLTENLNRAITAQGCNLITISNSNFYKLMQAVATLNNQTIIKGCTFDYIKDNDVYNLSYEDEEGNLIMSNNYISNRHDEGIVIRGKKTILSNNIIENIPTAINLAGDCEDLIISNNCFSHIGTGSAIGNVLSFRDNDYKLTNLIFKDNNVTLTDEPNANGQYMFIGDCTNIDISNNNISYKGIDYARGIYINKVVNLKFLNNTITDSSGSSLGNAVQCVNAPTTALFRDNITGSLRFPGTKVKNIDYISTSFGPYVTSGNKKFLLGGSIPTTGSWEAGDILLNALPSAGGDLGWVCVTAGSPGTWKSIGTIAE